MKCKVYLCGAEKNAPEGFTNWRGVFEESINADDITVLDPMKHFNYTTKQPLTNKQCMNYYMWLIQNSDVLIVNLDYTEMSVGSGMEVLYASMNHKPVIGFGEHKNTWYGWIEEKCDMVCEDMEDVIAYIEDKYVI